MWLARKDYFSKGGKIDISDPLASVRRPDPGFKGGVN